MEFSPEQLFQFFAQTGSLIRFEPGTVFGNTNPHIAVVVNADPDTQKAVVVVCATSQIDKARNFAARRRLSPNTVVCISGGTIIAAMDLVKERGLCVQQIKVVSSY